MAIVFQVNKSAFDRVEFPLYDPVTGEVEHHYLDLRKQLSDREWNEIDTRLFTGINADTSVVQIDPAGMTAKNMATWILGWSFRGPSGANFRPTQGNIEDLPPDIARICRELISEHAAKVLELRFALRDPLPAPSPEQTGPAIPATASGELTSPSPTPGSESTTTPSTDWPSPSATG